jgi:hypothetical protein
MQAELEDALHTCCPATSKDLTRLLTELYDEAERMDAIAGEIPVTPSDAAGFPVTLDTRGSYVLTGNLTVSAAGTSAIHITQTQVSIDLNGFTIDGPSVCTGDGSALSCAPGGGYGIESNTNYSSVRNGIISGFGSGGITTGVGDGARIEGITVEANGGMGINLDDHGVVRNCIAIRNHSNGIQGNSGTVVTNSIAAKNFTDGFNINGSGSVIGSVAWDNGDDGISVVMGAVTDNVALTNENDGIVASSDSLVRGNAVGANVDHGLDVGPTLGRGAAYIHNNFNSNGTSVGGSSPTQMGTNMCDGNTTCP